MNRPLLAAALLLPLGFALAAGCSHQAQADLEEETIELATLMGELQRHSTKLGFAIRGQNSPLADFYLTEVGEVLSEVLAVRELEGMPIGATASVIMTPLLADLKASLLAGDWTASSTAYEGVIEGCNRCHAATEHEFIKLLSEPNETGFAQSFR